MNNFLNYIKQLATSMRELWLKLTLNQKVLTGGAATLLIVALFIAALNGGKNSSYEALYTDLTEKDAADIVSKLDEYKVEYNLEDQGATIMVPAEQKYKIRLRLAGEDLPRGEAGLELFQESSFGETQTDKKVKYQMALQGELARTIQSIDKVKAAKVNLALPEESLFSDNEENPKASVVIRTDDGDSLTAKEVHGIVNLVANSVERLDPEDVVVVDQDGNLLSDSISDMDTASNADTVKNQLAMKRQYEREKQAAIQTMLDKTLGKDNSVVRVNAELDFDAREQKDEKYTHDPEGAFVRSEEISKESGTNTEQNNAAVPGTDSNIPQYDQAETNTGESSYTRSDKTINYEVNKTETVTKFSQGDVKYDYLTVSVLVNNAAVSKSKLGETEEERIAKIRNIVAAACGLREERNEEDVVLDENISVAFIDFYTEAEPETQSSSGINQLLKSPIGAVFLAVLGLVIAFLVGTIIRRKRHIEEDEEKGFEAIVEEEIKIEDLIDKTLTPEEKEKQKIRQEIDKLIDESPEDAAQVIRAWLSEDAR